VAAITAREAYWLLWSMRRLMPKRSIWRVIQFDTLRLRLIKLAARVIELKTEAAAPSTVSATIRISRTIWRCGLLPTKRQPSS
jgi:hypothetical protein